MLAEIKSKYHEFGDAVISEIIYSVTGDYKRNVVVKLNAYNWQIDKREAITLSFGNVVKFRFSETKKTNSTVIFEAYIGKIDDLIIFDFFALQISQNKVAEDPNSDFVIHCKDMKYEVMPFP